MLTLKRNHDLALNKIDNNEDKGPSISLISKKKKKNLDSSGKNIPTTTMSVHEVSTTKVAHLL